MAPFGKFVGAAREDLVTSWAPDHGAKARLAAAIGHALRYDTWRSLAHGEGLDDEAAAGLMIELARAATSPETPLLPQA